MYLFIDYVSGERVELIKVQFRHHSETINFYSLVLFRSKTQTLLMPKVGFLPTDLFRLFGFIFSGRRRWSSKGQPGTQVSVRALFVLLFLRRKKATVIFTQVEKGTKDRCIYKKTRLSLSVSPSPCKSTYLSHLIRLSFTTCNREGKKGGEGSARSRLAR